MRAPVVCLLGPTASGKSAAAMAYAERGGIEIVSLDSALVYRGMDIGTAKPSVTERARVRHHLIDIRDPAESYSAAQYASDALSAIADIAARGHQPLLVGGTLLYYRALTEGMHSLPGADPDLRAALDAEAATQGWPALHARLAAVDPVTAARLAPNDAQRIQRALEVQMLTGQPMSTLLASARGPSAAAAAGLRFAAIALEPRDRAWLHARIAQRFDAMIEQGLIEEVARLRERDDLHPGLPSMRSVGYRQVWQYLAGECDFAGMREQGIAATRQLAKRQLTWLRAMAARVSIDCAAPDALARTLAAIDAAGLG